jgi:hypothetical protein
VHPVSLGFDRGELAALCRRHRIRRLAMFGSVLRCDDDRASDLDILIEFEPRAAAGQRFNTIQAGLSTIFRRRVDLNTPEFLSRHFRDRVLAEAVPLYEAA